LLPLGACHERVARAHRRRARDRVGGERVSQDVTARTHADWTALADRLATPSLAWIGGPVPALSGATRATVDPATGRVLADVAECGVDDVDRAVALARRAFEAGRWSQAHPRERAAVLSRWADLVLDHLDELALLDSLDAGKRIADTSTIDVPGS